MASARDRNKPQSRIAASASDAGLWRKVAGTITPLFGNTMPQDQGDAPESKPANLPPRKPSSRAASLAKPHELKPPPPPPPPSPANLDSGKTGGISAADARRLKAGEARIIGRIDLHGMTLDEAEHALRRFVMQKAGAHGGGVVLVITGKGRDGAGVIRKALPRWLAAHDVARLVVAYCRARPRDGGDGAFYLKLRKQKP